MVRAILVVDDEPDILRSMQDLLSLLPDCDVDVAASCAEGRAKAVARDWAMIISDEKLPDGSGRLILADAAKGRPGSVRVLMSAFEGRDLARGPQAQYVDHFLQKPWEPEAMLAWLQRTLDGAGAGS